MRHGLWDHVCEKLSTHSGIFGNNIGALLLGMTVGSLWDWKEPIKLAKSKALYARDIELLLALNADPNTRTVARCPEQVSAWEQFLISIIGIDYSGSLTWNCSLLKGLFETFLEYGADCEAVCKFDMDNLAAYRGSESFRCLSVTEVIKHCFLTEKDPTGADHLLAMVQELRVRQQSAPF